MTDHEQKITAADLTATELAALDRAARRLRSRAFLDAFASLGAWVHGPVAEAKTPAAGRTA